MSKETSARVAKIAGRVLGGDYGATEKELRSLAASALTQVEQEKLRPPKWSKLTKKQREIFTVSAKFYPAKDLYELAIGIMGDLG